MTVREFNYDKHVETLYANEGRALEAGIEHYRGLTPGGEVTVNLSRDEAAVCIKAHDFGIRALSEKEKCMVDYVMSLIKWSLRN
ncbi:hypothetical protein [Thalassomonas sp. M1454]|uniref:hypothetical protein n=1 Tax=Thalassomonas sp. M1454 TaxID=2594477 RepID=UPI00117DCFE7|nr:hypothetical protein [Thalassomonas sp. M1454]TRX53467.1 hypothetical protein FNN08_14435 [Thalassomonas sp. M1454]